MEQLQMQESAMDCSEEEGSVGETERIDDWENGDRNQMDCEEAEFVQEAAQNAFKDSSVAEKPSEDLEEIVEARIKEKQALEEILNVQVENIVELQNACERTSYTLDQIPALRELASQRCSQVLSEIQDLKNKQNCVSELIEFTVQKYDEDLQKVYCLKEEFQTQKHLNYERFTVFKADLLNLTTIGQSFAFSIQKRIMEKRELFSVLENHLVQLEKASVSVNELNAKVDATFQEASSLNSAVFEGESQLENSKKNLEEVKNQIHQENAKFSLKMEDYKRKELESSVDLNILQGRIEKARLDLQRLLTENEEFKAKLAFLQNKLAESESDKQMKAAAKLALTFQLTELHDQQSTLSQTMSGLTRCKNLIATGENDLRSLEAELERLTSRSVDLETKRSEIDGQIVSYEKYVQEAVDRTECLEEEFKKLEQELPRLRSAYDKETNEVGNNESKIEKELSYNERNYDDMVELFGKLSAELESCESKLSKLLQSNESLKESISKKRSLAEENEEAVKSIKEEKESISAEWNALSEQERTDLKTVNTVKQLNNELTQGKAALAEVIETTNRMLLDIGNEHNKKMEEKVKEIESKKREYVKALEERSKEAAKLEEEYKSFRSKATVFSSLAKEAAEQSELFSCEKSLFRTFAEWVFKNDSVAPNEEWVTSTSDAKFFGDSQPQESQEDIKVKPVKTSYK